MGNPQLSKSILIAIGGHALILEPEKRPLRFRSFRRGTKLDATIKFTDSSTFLSAVERIRGGSIGFVLQALLVGHADVRVRGTKNIVVALNQVRRAANANSASHS